MYPRLQYHLFNQPTKRGWLKEPHERVAQNFFPRQTDYVTERIRIPAWNLIPQISRTHYGTDR